MKKQKRALFASAVIFLGLIAVFFAVRRAQNEKAAEAEARDIEETALKNAGEDEQTTLIDRSKSDIVKITFTNGKGAYTLTHLDPEANGGREWALLEYPGAELASYTVNGMATSFYYLSPSETLATQAPVLSDYGLSSADNPAHATALYQNGDTETITVGNKTPAGDYYYLMKEGDGRVYLVLPSYGERFLNGYNEIIDKTVPKIDFTSLREGKITEKGKPPFEISFDEKIGDYAEHMASVGETILIMDKPYAGRDVYLSAMTNYFSDFMSYSSFGDLADIDCADLSRYGLDEPEILVRFEDTDKVLELSVGDFTDDDCESAYVCFSGKRSVFTMDAAILAPLRNINPFKFIERYCVRPLPNIGTVDSIKITAPEFNRTDNILINHQDSPPKTDGTGEIAPTVNAKAADSEAFRMFYRAIIGISVDAPVSGYVIADEPQVTVTFNFNTGRAPAVCKFYPYDENFYAVSADGGEVEFLAGKQVIKTSFEYLDAAVIR